jgi:hypothetical protein
MPLCPKTNDSEAISSSAMVLALVVSVTISF